MTVTVVALNQTILDNCDSNTDNDATGVDTVDFKQNSASCYWTLRSSGNNDAMFTKATGTWDLSGTGVHVRFWAMFAQGSLINLAASGGIQLGLSDGTNTGFWYIGGRDTYPGGWFNFCVDVSAAVDAGTKPTMTAITDVIIRLNLTASGKNFANTWIDYLHVCDGLRVYGDDAGGYMDFEDIYTQDNTDNSSTVGGWGIIKKLSGIYFLAGEIEFGDSVSTNGLKFQAKNQTCVFEDRLVNANLYNFTVVDNGTGTTEFLLGEKSGTAGINGCTVLVESTAQAAQADLLATDVDISNFGVYGSTFIGFQDIDLPATSTLTEVLNSNFIQCGEVDPSTCTITNCNFISPDITSTEGAILFDQATHNVSSCAFIACDQALHVSFDGTVAITSFTFTNNTYDVVNTTVATNMSDYQPTEDGDQDLYSGGVIRLSQTFTATAGDLSRAIWSLRKQGSPTGNAYARLYAVTTGGQPTGAALAESNPVDVSGLTTSFADVVFEFEDEYTLSATDYAISVEFSGGDASNRVEVEYLTAGNTGEYCYTYTSSWSSQTFDARYKVNRDGIVKVTATTSNPGTAVETGATKGATIIVSSVNINVTVKDVDNNGISLAQVAVYRTSDDVQLMNEDTVTGGLATESIPYPGSPFDVYYRVRKSSVGDTRYRSVSGVGQVDSGGMNVTVVLEQDQNVSL